MAVQSLVQTLAPDALMMSYPASVGWYACLQPPTREPTPYAGELDTQ